MSLWTSSRRKRTSSPTEGASFVLPISKYCCVLHHQHTANTCLAVSESSVSARSRATRDCVGCSQFVAVRTNPKVETVQTCPDETRGRRRLVEYAFMSCPMPPVGFLACRATDCCYFNGCIFFFREALLWHCMNQLHCGASQATDNGLYVRPVVDKK